MNSQELKWSQLSAESDQNGPMGKLGCGMIRFDVTKLAIIVLEEKGYNMAHSSLDQHPVTARSTLMGRSIPMKFIFMILNSVSTLAVLHGEKKKTCSICSCYQYLINFYFTIVYMHALSQEHS